MPTYEYRCAACGDFPRVLPMSGPTTAPAECPRCGGPASRRFGPPALGRTGRALGAARTAEEASRDAPAVVRRAAPAPQQGAPAAVRARPDRPPLPRP